MNSSSSLLETILRFRNWASLLASVFLWRAGHTAWFLVEILGMAGGEESYFPGLIPLLSYLLLSLLSGAAAWMLFRIGFASSDGTGELELLKRVTVLWWVLLATIAIQILVILPSFIL